MPEPFELNEARRNTASRHGLERVSDQWALFKAHHESIASRFADWDKAWLTWCLREKMHRRTRPPVRQAPNPAPASVIDRLGIPAWLKTKRMLDRRDRES